MVLWVWEQSPQCLKDFAIYFFQNQRIFEEARNQDSLT